jgi:putative membrane-bound dehydrogenase-like protein
VVAAALSAKEPDHPLPPSEAAARMTLPEGFQATLFAGEPDLVQPIAFSFDDRGRLWVAECLSYPEWIKDGKEGKDRILIFEDKNGDGRFTSRKVFFDKIANISGIEIGFGGVWVCAVPNLLFIPFRDGEDVPSGPPQVVLDGWDVNAKHNVFNGLRWGPDGWLYGCNGILSNSKVGRPGTAEVQRIKLNCGVWRYHPVHKQFEVVASGTTNPWGLDFDDYGQMFITNCVIKHLWHVVPGAHFQRMFGQDLNPNCYSLMESIADHIHWAGGHWTSSRGGQGAHNESGGGHAHSGAMLYLGDNWPDRYRNGAFMCNIHGNRVNHDYMERQGSTYVAHHGKDFLFANDPWFRGLALGYGPDGGVFVSDWTDTGECHNYQTVDRTNGRIYKVTYGKPKHFEVNLAALSDAELVKLQLHRNDWFVRHARLLLQERAAGKLKPETADSLRKMLQDEKSATGQLRALWALHSIGGLDEKQQLALLEHPHEHVRAWTIQLALEDRKGTTSILKKLAEMARKDPAALVRLYLASALQRLPLEDRWPIAEELVQHGEDAQDPYLPLMIWYGIEPLTQASSDRSLALLRQSHVSLVREYLARRLASSGIKATGQPSTGMEPLMSLIALEDDPSLHRDILRGIHDALAGRRKVPMPKGWQAAYPSLASSPVPEVRELTVRLALQFGDPAALASLKKMARDATAGLASRQKALQALIEQQPADLQAVLFELLDDQPMRAQAIRGLAGYEDSEIPGKILAVYKSLSGDERADAIHTLTSRTSFALALLDGVEKGLVARQDLTPFTVRQILGLNSTDVTTKVNKVWGALRPASQEKVARMATYKSMLSPEFTKKADISAGRLVFSKTCASCHKLFDEGGSIGPELTGAQRSNLDYVLENVLDPSAVVASEYQVTFFHLKNGRVISGIVRQENDKVVTVQTQNEQVRIPLDDIVEREKTKTSMMPEGLFDKLTMEEIRDLIAYLAGPNQVPLPTKK